MKSRDREYKSKGGGTNEGRREREGEILRISEVYKKNCSAFLQSPKSYNLLQLFIQNQKYCIKVGTKKIN